MDSQLPTTLQYPWGFEEEFRQLRTHGFCARNIGDGKQVNQDSRAHLPRIEVENYTISHAETILRLGWNGIQENLGGNEPVDITEYQLNLQWYRLQGICFANRNALQYLQVLEKNTRLDLGWLQEHFVAIGHLELGECFFQNKSKTLDLNGYHFLNTDFYWYLPIEPNSLILSKKK